MEGRGGEMSDEAMHPLHCAPAPSTFLSSNCTAPPFAHPIAETPLPTSMPSSSFISLMTAAWGVSLGLSCEVFVGRRFDDWGCDKITHSVSAQYSQNLPTIVRHTAQSSGGFHEKHQREPVPSHPVTEEAAGPTARQPTHLPSWKLEEASKAVVAMLTHGEQHPPPAHQGAPSDHDIWHRLGGQVAGLRLARGRRRGGCARRTCAVARRLGGGRGGACHGAGRRLALTRGLQ